MLTLGSLFDGAGTFPFAAQQCGVKAVWASEIESFPVEVTKKRFPEMKHLGDIPRGTLSNRLNMLGWSVEKALGGGKV